MITTAAFAFFGCLMLIFFSKYVIGRLVQRPEGTRPGELGLPADDWSPGSNH